MSRFPSAGLRCLTLLLALALALAALAGVPGAARADDSARPDHHRVRTYDYDLGDRAFHVRGFHAVRPNGTPGDRLAPIELTGRVYVPADAAGARLPVVVIAHGLFWTCADDATDKVDVHWPCRGRRTSIRSDLGYDNLGRALAARGMLVVSVGANGVNAGELGEVADRARAYVVFHHLRMWQALVENGSGPLVGALRNARTGRPVSPDLDGAADLHDVGLLGHSRGGRGMMWAAADIHREMVPEGIRIRAVFGMAAAEPPFMGLRARRLQVGRIPLMTWSGTCDVTGRDEYNRLASRAGDRVNIGIAVHGANHDNLNARWAAASGLPGSEDDALHPDGRPGKCYADDPNDLDDTLGYHAERRVAATYVRAFFARYLQGDRSADPVLSGHRHPVHDLTRVDVRRYPPAP